VLGRPPHCGPRRARKKTVRTVATQCDQLQQLRLSTKHCSQTFTPTSTEVVTSASPTSTSGCATTTVDDHLSVINLLNICDVSRPSSAESSSSPTAPARKRESPRSDAADGASMSHGDVSVSMRSLRCATLPLDNVDLWEDSSDTELMVLTASGPLPTTTATQTWMTTANNDDSERHSAMRARERRKWNIKRHNQHPTSCRLYQQTARPATSAVDSSWTESDWRCPSLTQVTPTAAAACNSRGFIPSIIESSGRPATANTSAAELSHGSVELHQRRTGAGLDLFIRGMQLRLVNNDERPMTRSDVVKVTQANVTSQQRHSVVDRLRFTSAMSSSTLRLH